MKCFGVVAIDCFIQNALLVNGVIFPHVTTVNFHMYMIAFICLFTQLLPKYFRTPAVQFSRSVVSNSLQPHESQHARPPCSSSAPGVQSDSRPSSQWCHPAISSSVIPFSSQLWSFPASRSFQMGWFFASGGQSIGVSASTSVLITLRTDLWDGLVGSPCSPRDSQESSTSQFKSINTSTLSFLYSPTLTSIHDYWKNHSYDYTDLCW